MTTKEIDKSIEEMLIAKVAHYRLNIQTQFRNRHSVSWPELLYKTINSDIRKLKKWQRMAELIQPTHNPPYTTYLAKQLTQV